MAGAINLTEVDFDQIKSNLIDYLKSTGKFTDFDFEGSNLQVILNLLAYQGQLNAYTANMVANESFLSSATLRNNVAANARMVGYTPVSARAATTEIDFQYQLQSADYPNGFPRTLTINPGLAFTTEGGNNNLFFNVINPYTSAVTNSGLCRFSGIKIHEGTRLTTKFTRDETVYNQKFLIENQKVDTTTIVVDVQEIPTEQTLNRYTIAANLVEIDDDSRVFWLEEVDDGRYELTFGDGLFGKKLKDGAVVNVSYLVTHGPDGNGVRGIPSFTFVGNVKDNNGNTVVTRPTITSVQTTTGGSELEDVSSIKFRAPRQNAAQNRCVISEDYESLVRRIYPAAQDIYVFGGEELEIPQYGRVYIAIKPRVGDTLTNQAKSYIRKSLDEYRIASLDLIIQDATTLNVEVVSVVYYDDKKTNNDSATITAKVKTTLSNLSASKTVSKFGGAVRYSRVIGSIDDSDNSITRNNTTLRLRRDMEAVLASAASYEVCFDNPIKNVAGSNQVSVWSTGFRISGDPNIFYFEDDSNGNVRLFYFDGANAKIVVNATFGSVDYAKGEVLLGYTTPITIVNTVVGDETVEIRAIPGNQDVLAKQSVYINLDVGKSDIVSVVDTQITGS